MPGVFHDPPAQLIRQICLGQPLPKPYIITLRPLLDPPSSNAELGATRCTNFPRHLDAREQLHEPRFEVFAGVDVFAVGVGVRPDLRRTSQDPGATEIHVALVMEVAGLDSSQHGDAVVVGVVVVPLVALGVDEEHPIGETVVVVDDIA